MFKRIRLLIAGLLIVTGFTTKAQKWVEMMNDPESNFYEVREEFNKYWEGRTYEKGKGWKQFKRWENFMEARVDSTGHIPNNGTWKAVQQYKNNYTPGKAGIPNWYSLGAFNVPANGGGAGRLNCVTFHPTNPNKIFVGAPAGGLWVSDDGGQNWYTNTDMLASLGITDIAIDPSNPNIMYLATGDDDGDDTYSVGVLKSTDGGLNWNNTGLSWTTTYNRTIARILIDPVNTQKLIIATSFGIKKSIDAGATWTSVKSGSFRDIAFKPGNSQIIYAAKTNRFYKSEDGGSTFILKSTSGLPTNPGRIAIGVTPDDSEYVYLLISNNTNQGFLGVYRSTDSGENFSIRASSPNLLGWNPGGSDVGGQAAYDLAIAVSPSNKNVLYVGGVNIWKSVNGGSNWVLNAHWYGGANKPMVHADIHALKFHSSDPTKLYACSDGGISGTTNGGSSWSDLSDDISIGQMYRIGASKTDYTKVLTGWQDNGTNYYINNNWTQVMGGDGMECIIDYSNNNYMYCSLQQGRIFRSVNGGGSWSYDPLTDDILTNEQGAWVTPFIIHPTSPTTLYSGFENVWKSTNRGNTWSKISDFSSTNTIKAMAISDANPAYLYVATYYNIYKSVNGGSSWADITSGLPSTAKISYISIHSEDPKRIWVSLSGYYAADKVYKSEDGGVTWTNITGTLPNIPVNCVLHSKTYGMDGVYIGTDIGVYYKGENMSDWIPYMQDLPNVIVNELEVTGIKLRAATFGRGLWEADSYSYVNSIKNYNKYNTLKIFPNPTEGIVNIELIEAVNERVNIMIYDAADRLVHSETMMNSDKKISVDLSDKNNGLYFVKIISNNAKYSASFVKKSK